MARSRENLIAIDVIDHDILVKRELLKDRKKHGVQREWHLNGRPKVEAPYKNGIMEGVFRAFDDKGALVGQYAMLQGNGTVVIYDSSGRLTSEDQYKNNLREGLRMERIANLISLTWSKNGHPIGKGYGFFENSGLAAITFFSNSGDPVGPVVEFSSAGSLTKKSWYLNNRIVTETEYAAAASKDPSLPPYYAEVRQYKQFVSEEVQALLTKYRTMPRVKIPLQ